MEPKPLHIMAMKKLAEPALLQALQQIGLSSSGLFLMMHPSAISAEGRGVFEYAIHEKDSEVPTVKARASVDAFSGEVHAEASKAGLVPWRST